MQLTASKKLKLFVLATAVLLRTAATAPAQTLYEETWANPDPGSGASLAAYGWSATGAVGYSGVYDQALTEASTGRTFGQAIYMGSGAAGAVMGYYTTDASTALSGFTDISFTGNLVFATDAQLQGGGSAANETRHFLVQVGGNWYASASSINGPSDSGSTMDLDTMTLNPTAANWITVGGIGTGSITYGSMPASNLGSPITGVGVVFTLNDSSYSTENYTDFEVSLPPSVPVVGTPSAAPNPAYALSPVMLSDSASGAGTLTYQWQTNSDLTGGLAGAWVTISGATTPTITNIPSDIGSSYTLDYQLIVTNSIGSTTSAPVVLTIYPASVPTLVSDTTPSSVYTYAGGTVTLSASFTGTLPINYIWQTDSGQTGIFTNIPGATGTTLTLANIQPGNSGNYQLLAFNSQGGQTSTPANLAILPAIYLETFTTPKLGDQTVTNAGWINDIVGNNNTRLYNGGTNGAVYSYVGGAATEAYYVTTVSENGSIIETAPPVEPTLTYQQAFPSIPATTSNLTFFVDLDSTYNAANELSYFCVQMNFTTWYVSATALGQPDNSGTLFLFYQAFDPTAGNWNQLTVSGTGTVNTSATVGGPAPSDLLGTITGAGIVCVHNGGGTHNFDNFAIAGTLGSDTCPVINAPPFSTTNYTGTTVTLSVAATTNGTTAGLTYQWKAGTVGSGIYGNLSNGGQYSGVTSSILVISNITSAANHRDYVCVVSDAAPCSEQTTPATLTVTDSPPLLVSDTAITPNNINAGNNNLVVMSASFVGDLPIAYQWQYSPNADGSGSNNVPGAASTTFTLLNPQTNNSGYYSLQALNSQSGGVPTNSSWMQLSVGGASSSLFTWGPPVPFNGQTSVQILGAPAGMFFEAEVFNGSGGNVNVGNAVYVFDSTGASASITGTGGPGTSAIAFSGTTGDPNFDSILGEEQEDEGTPTITLHNLTVGTQYSVQLFALDDTHDSSRFTAFADPNNAADVSQSYTVGANDYIVGAFIANASDVVINQVLANFHGYMGSVVVRVQAPTVSIQPSGGSFQVSWPYGTLLQATNLTGPWTTNTDTSPITIMPTGSRMFFRGQYP